MEIYKQDIDSSVINQTVNSFSLPVDSSTKPEVIKPSNKVSRNWVIVIIFILIIAMLSLIIIFSFSYYENKKNPSAGVSINTTYNGSWQTPNEDPIPLKLTLVSVNGEKGTIRYEWGDDNFGGRSLQEVNILDNGKRFTWDVDQIHLDFTLIEDGSLKGERTEGVIKSSIVMKK